MKNLNDLIAGNDLIIDFLKKNNTGIFSTQSPDGVWKNSEAKVRFINKKPIPSIEISFIEENVFYKHRVNLHRGLDSERDGQLFALVVTSKKDGIAKIGGVAQFIGMKKILVIVHFAEFVSGKDGLKSSYYFLKKS